jgi:putative ABC transport system permease protein
MNFKFLKIFGRSLKRHKIITTINILGLVTGLLSSLFILEYVYFERSFDSYHQHVGQVYRVVYDRYQNEKIQWKTANSFYPTGKWMKENCAEVEDYTVISRKYNITVNYDDAVGNKVFYNEPKSYYATSSLFRLFTIPLVQGGENCLDQPNTVAISDKVAERYFGRENPIGKLLTVNATEKYTITAVYRDVPANSHLQTGFLFSLQTIISQRQWLQNNWSNDYFHTYLMLKPGTDAATFTRRAFPEMVAKNYKADLDASNTRDEFILQALPDIHLHSNIEYETEPPGNAKIVSILFGFALFLITVAWINYINLVTAQALERAKEIGIRKINGAGKFRLIIQFLVEAFIFNLICLGITLFLFFLINPVFRVVTGIEDFSLFRQPSFLAVGFIVFCSGIVLSAIYPALILSSYQPIAVLKGKFKNSGQGIVFRKALVTIQFVISIVLLSGTLVSYRQATFLLNKDMGINFSKALVVRAPITADKGEIRQNKLMLFRDQVLQLPEVKDFTFSSDVPGQEIDHWFAGYRKGFSDSDMKAYFQIAVDDQFLDFYQVKLLAGRKFAKDEKAEQRNVLMNVQAINRFGYTTPEEAVDQIIMDWGKNEYRVVGVVDDFQYKSVKTEPVPTVLTLNNGSKSFLTIRMNDQSNVSYSSLVAKLQSLYEQNFPDHPFEYFSLDDKMLLDLKPDKTFASVFGLFSILAILVAVIGIVGLILITISQNLKELGIRKALGAEIGDVYSVLSRQFLYQFLAAMMVAVPLSYYGFEKWFLSTYIHRINLNVWILLVPIFLIGVIVFAVVYLLSARAYRLKVAQVLQNE